MKLMSPLHQPPSESGSLESGPVILRDGTTASLHATRPEDQAMMQRFIDRLSSASRRHRFFSETAPPADTIRSLCDSSNPSKQLTIMVMRTIGAEPRIVAAGSYWARTADEAEVAMAVDDDFHGKGLGTILLERLAMLAIHRGFTRLWAVTHTDNLAMREVFRESGYPVHETYEGGDMQVELSLHPTESTTTRLELRERIATMFSDLPNIESKFTELHLGGSRGVWFLVRFRPQNTRRYGFRRSRHGRLACRYRRRWRLHRRFDNTPALARLRLGLRRFLQLAVVWVFSVGSRWLSRLLGTPVFHELGRRDRRFRLEWLRAGLRRRA